MYLSLLDTEERRMGGEAVSSCCSGGIAAPKVRSLGEQSEDHILFTEVVFLIDKGKKLPNSFIDESWVIR